MNIYAWIALIAALDVALILFVRGADERRSNTKRRIKQPEAQP